MLRSLLLRNPALTYALLGLLAAVFVLIAWQDEEGPTIGAGSDLRGPREPDGFIVNATYRAYDHSGHLSSRVKTGRAEQFEDEQYALMDLPEAAVFEKETGQPWVITSQDGRYDLETEHLLLLGDVEVIRENPEMAPTRLLSERLTLDNRQRIVHTDAPVTLLDYRGTTDAVGMRGWVGDRILEFQSQVQGEYVTENITNQP